MENAARGFAWWGPHDRARRSAELLLAAVAIICATYVAIVVGAVVLAVRIVQVGSGDDLDSWPHALGPLGVAGITIVFVGVVSALIAVAASGSLAARATRLAGSRPLAPGEAEHAQRCVESFALAVGFTSPRVHVVEDPTPNGFASGRRHKCAVCLTRGALRLPPNQLDALCAQTITSVANRALPLTCAAADLVIVARWCTKAVWGTMAVLLVSTIVGVPPLLAAAVTIAITLVVVLTMPLLTLADRAIPRLRDRSAQLADLDAVSLTNEPGALAHLLLTTAGDRGTVATPWQIAHLWFDPDTARPAPGTIARGLESWFETHDDAGSYSARRSADTGRHALVERARVLVELTTGDRDLRAQLERAERASS